MALLSALLHNTRAVFWSLPILNHIKTVKYKNSYIKM